MSVPPVDALAPACRRPASRLRESGIWPQAHGGGCFRVLCKGKQAAQKQARSASDNGAMDDPRLADNPEKHRFELRAGDDQVAAWSEYNVLKGALLFTHTEVLPEYERRGLGSRLAAFALDEVRRRGVHVIPACPFIAAYLRKHPEYRDLVTEESRRAFHV
jgi:uncharacterized protein